MDILEKLDMLVEEDNFEDISDSYDSFFATAGKLLDSLDTEKVSDDTHDLVDSLIDSIIDVILSLSDENFDKKTNDIFMEIVDMLGLDDEISEGLAVKARKVASGRKRSQSSRKTGADKMKYLKRLRERRKTYKKSASLRRKTKRKSKKYKKTAGAKIVKRKYKALNK